MKKRENSIARKKSCDFFQCILLVRFRGSVITLRQFFFIRSGPELKSRSGEFFFFQISFSSLQSKVSDWFEDCNPRRVLQYCKSCCEISLPWSYHWGCCCYYCCYCYYCCCCCRWMRWWCWWGAAPTTWWTTSSRRRQFPDWNVFTTRLKLYVWVNIFGVVSL